MSSQEPPIISKTPEKSQSLAVKVTTSAATRGNRLAPAHNNLPLITPRETAVDGNADGANNPGSLMFSSPPVIRRHSHQRHRYLSNSHEPEEREIDTQDGTQETLSDGTPHDGGAAQEEHTEDALTTLRQIEIAQILGEKWCKVSNAAASERHAEHHARIKQIPYKLRPMLTKARALKEKVLNDGGKDDTHLIKAIVTTQNVVVSEELNCQDICRPESWLKDHQHFGQTKGVYISVWGRDRVFDDNLRLRFEEEFQKKEFSYLSDDAKNDIRRIFSCVRNESGRDDRLLRVKIGMILDEHLFQRMRTLHQSEGQFAQMIFIGTNDLCDDKVKELEDLLKYVCYRSSMATYSGRRMSCIAGVSSEVFYMQRNHIDFFITEAVDFVKTGSFDIDMPSFLGETDECDTIRETDIGNPNNPDWRQFCLKTNRNCHGRDCEYRNGRGEVSWQEYSRSLYITCKCSGTEEPQGMQDDLASDESQDEDPQGMQDDLASDEPQEEELQGMQDDLASDESQDEEPQGVQDDLASDDPQDEGVGRARIQNPYRNDFRRGGNRISEADSALGRKNLGARTLGRDMSRRKLGKATLFPAVIEDQNDDEEEEVDKPKIPGIQNLGNTCYLSASLQTLYSIPQFLHKLYQSYEELCSFKELPLTTALLEIAVTIGALKEEDVPMISPDTARSTLLSSKAANPSALKKQMDVLTDKFAGYEQRDAHEFLGDLVDFLHEELVDSPSDEKDDDSKKSEESNSEDAEEKPATVVTTDLPTDEYFHLKVRVCLKCKSCGYSRSKEELYRHLSIDVGEDDDGESWGVERSLEHFFQAEDRELNCEKCEDGTSATQTMEIISRPKAILLHFKRFIVTQRDNGEMVLRKNKAKIPLKDSLSISFFFSAEEENPNGLYHLCGVVHHVGNTAFSGHYTTCAKRNLEEESVEEQWVFFDDTVGRRRTINYVTGNETNQKNCYMALYELK
eukprot:scaffold3206_cov119-Skeletonema_marinoi.AAC.1